MSDDSYREHLEHEMEDARRMIRNLDNEISLLESRRNSEKRRLRTAHDAYCKLPEGDHA